MCNVLCCYGEKSTKENIEAKELPKYFSTEEWEMIRRINEQNVGGSEEIIAIMDVPVEYIGGLEGQNKQNIQSRIIDIISKIKHKHFVKDYYHGTAVAGLIASKPCKLPCYVEKGVSTKGCRRDEPLVVSGIAQHTKIANIPRFESGAGVEEAIKKVLPGIVSLTEAEKNESRVLREVPVKIILNFSFGLADKDLYIQMVKKEIPWYG